MKRNWKSRVFAGFLCAVLMFGLLPTGFLSDLMPEVVPDMTVDADAISTARLNGLFIIRDRDNPSWVLTAADTNSGTLACSFAAYTGATTQLWIVVSNDMNNVYIRPLRAVYAYANDSTNGYGDMWLGCPYTPGTTEGGPTPYKSAYVLTVQQGYNSPATHSADFGKPSDKPNVHRFELANVSADGDSVVAHLRSTRGGSGNYYLYRNGTAAAFTHDLNATALSFEPAYDPDMSYNGPLVIVNQPGGNTGYWLNDTGSSITMPQGSGESKVNATQAQTWALVKATKGYFFIVNRSTGKYLGADANGVLSSAVNTGESYQWQIFHQRDDGSAASFRFVNKYTGYTLHFTGSTLSAKNMDTSNPMHQYISLSYNRKFTSDNLWSTYYISTFNSNSSIYWPATFDDKNYISIKLNYIKDCNERTGYLFHTAATNSPTGIDSMSTSTVSGNAAGYVQNTAVQGFDYTAPSYSPDVGNVRVKFTFTKSSSQNTNPFLIIEGHYNGGTTSVTIKNSGGTTVASGSQADYGRKEINVSSLANGTYTLELSGGEHYGIFTNITPDGTSGTPTMTLTDSTSGGANGKVVHGDTTFSLKISNPRNQAITKVSFTVTISGGHNVTLTCSNGSNSSSNSAVATLSGGSNQIAANESATWTIKLLYSGMTAGSNYTITVNAGTSYAFSGNAAPATLNITKPSNTMSVTKCNGGGVTASVTVNPNGGFVSGNIVYTITLKNTCNHNVNNFGFTFGKSGTTLLVVANGAESSKLSGVTVSGLSSGKSLAADGTWTITVTVPVSSLSADTGYQFAVSSGTAAGTSIQGSHAITFSSSNTTSVTTVSGSMSMTLSCNVATNSIVKGNVVYTIVLKNGTNHSVNNVNFTLVAGSTTLLTVTNGAFTPATGVTTDLTSIGTLTTGQSITLKVTVDTTKLTAGTTYAVSTTKGSCAASNLASGQSRTLDVPATSAWNITTVNNGGITMGLTSSTVNSYGVGEGDVIFKITLNSAANHELQNIVITLKDNAGNTLLTITKDGITINDATLVKNKGSVTTGSLASLGAKGSIVIDGIVIDATASKLDASGYLDLTVSGSAPSKNVLGSAGTFTLTGNSDSYIVMVRHDVDLLVQAGVQTTVSADKLLAAMTKSGATVYNGISGISAVTVTDINGNTVTKTGFGSNGSNLVINLTAEYGEYIVKVVYSGGSIMVPLQVTTVDAGEDKTFVLDYGLPVSIDKATVLNDLRLTGGSYPSITNTVTGFSAAISGAANLSLNGTFGNFAFANDAFGYTPAKFMDNEDAAYVVILVGNSTGTENVDYVNVYKKVSFIPSNVIYYEDTLVGSITYPGGYTLDALGELSAIGDSLIQDLPTTGNMGFDDGSYANATDVMLSGESVQQITVNGEQVTVSFTFTGTGFELISRVNAYDAATILVKVSPAGQENWTYYPVITRFDPMSNGKAEVYQTPVFRLNEVAYGSYDVQIVGLPRAAGDEYNDDGTPKDGYIVNYIYIDGIRVYNPLGNSNLTDHYGVEQGAEFTNLRDLILAGNATLASFESSNNVITGFTAAGSYYLNSDSKRFTAAVGSLDALGAIGANNEILVRNSQSGNQVIILRVKDNGNGFLQVGIHDIHDGKFDGTGSDNLSSTVKYNTTGGWVVLKENFKSGTEQYYNIDLSKCPTVDGCKIVALQVTSGFVSFSNIKHKDVEFVGIDPAAAAANVSFNDDGTMLMIDKDGNETTGNASDLFNLNEINYMMSQGDAEDETV